MGAPISQPCFQGRSVHPSDVPHYPCPRIAVSRRIFERGRGFPRPSTFPRSVFAYCGAHRRWLDDLPRDFGQGPERFPLRDAFCGRGMGPLASRLLSPRNCMGLATGTWLSSKRLRSEAARSCAAGSLIITHRLKVSGSSSGKKNPALHAPGRAHLGAFVLGLGRCRDTGCGRGSQLRPCGPTQGPKRMVGCEQGQGRGSTRIRSHDPCRRGRDCPSQGERHVGVS